MNKVIFTPIEYNSLLINEIVTKPQLAKSCISEIFKNIPRFQNNESEMIYDKSTGYHNLTVRHCMPFIDSMTSGYFLTTWTDIYIERKNNMPIIKYKDANLVEKINIPLIRYQQYFKSHIPPLQGFDDFLCAWSVYWRIKTDPDVSCLFVHPLNRTDLPFYTLSGITDTDGWNGSDVLNFALKKDFEGIIPKGTPYVQIIPFKRESWTLEVLSSVDNEKIKLRDIVNKKREERQTGYYRDNIWNKKNF